MTTVRTIESVPYSRVLADALAVPGTNTMRVAEDFFGLADIVKADQKLARALTDPSRSASDKRALVRTAFGPHVTAATSSVVAAMASDHWTRPEDVDAALEVLGILAVLNDALGHNALDDVREELFQVRYFLQNTRDLRVRLSDLRLGDEHERGDLASAVFASRVSSWTMRLIRRAVGRSRHGRLVHNLRRYAAWAATMQDRLFVTVATAHPMSDTQVERLRSILSKRFGAAIDLAISIDPDVIGGFVLRAGSTAVDATVRTRLADARARIVV